MLKIAYKYLSPTKHVVEYATTGAEGCDIFADIAEDIELDPGEHILIPTGVYPIATVCDVRPKSSSVKSSMYVLYGTVDGDYRDEILVGIVNLGMFNLTIKKGQKIAQLVKRNPAPRFTNINVKEKVRTGGYGSTDELPEGVH